jgi:hypothetical protein
MISVISRLGSADQHASAVISNTPSSNWNMPAQTEAGRRAIHASPPFGADYLVTITGMERWPVTTWVAVRALLVTAGLLPGFPGAGSMVMVAISWLLRG